MKHLETNWHRPIAKALITLQDLKTLKKCSEAHYDAHCRSVSVPGPGAFLHRWSSYFQDLDPRLVVKQIEVEEEFGVFDTCCKILEQSPQLGETPEAEKERDALRGAFAWLLVEMNSFVQVQRTRSPHGMGPRKIVDMENPHDLPPDDPEPDYKARYMSLIFAVARKFDGEDRFDTALRYIREAEGHPRALRLFKNDDGIWLHVDSGTKKAAILMQYRADGIVAQALEAACERPAEAYDKQGN